MIISYDNVWARVVSSSEQEKDWLDALLSCEHVVHRKSVNWTPDQRYHMLDRVTGIFPAGFVRLLGAAARKAGVSLQIQDTRECPAPAELDEALVPWLRDYQKRALWDALRKGGRGLIKSPTGSGKTEVLIGLTRVVPCEWLFLVASADIVEEMSSRFNERTSERVGTWTKGCWTPGTSNLTVATFQSITSSRRKRAHELRSFMGSVQGVLVDEVHGISAATFYKTALQLPQAYYRIGVSGTPLDRSDKDTLRTIGALGPMLSEISTQELVQKEVISRGIVRMVPFEHGKVAQDATWLQVYKSFIVQNSERNETVVAMANAAAKPSLLFVEELEHGRDIKKMLEAEDMVVGFVSGLDYPSSRKDKLDGLVGGLYDVLIATKVFQDGIDAEELRSVVVATGKASTVATLQRIGRGMRKTQDKNTFEVWDVLDKGGRWLADHAARRQAAYEREGHQVTIGW